MGKMDYCHSRECGNPVGYRSCEVWIPAFGGMTCPQGNPKDRFRRSRAALAWVEAFGGSGWDYGFEECSRLTIGTFLESRHVELLQCNIISPRDKTSLATSLPMG
jgi:hypothetical protein